MGRSFTEMALKAKRGLQGTVRHLLGADKDSLPSLVRDYGRRKRLQNSFKATIHWLETLHLIHSIAYQSTLGFTAISVSIGS